MAKFRAIVEGQNFLFMFDDQQQSLDFHRTLCLDAECIESAGEQALGCVIEELAQQAVLLQINRDKSHISLGHIERIEPPDIVCNEQDFIWYFPDDAVFEHKLKSQGFMTAEY